MCPNGITYSSQFRRLYRRKQEGPQYIVKRILNLLDQLINSEDPKSLGEHKKGRLEDSYSLRINRDSRILYRVYEVDGTTTVELTRICSHKNVYGKD